MDAQNNNKCFYKKLTSCDIFFYNNRNNINIYAHTYITGDKFMKKILLFFLMISIICTNMPSNACADEPTVPEISAPSAILVDYSTGKVLFEKNADEKKPLASVTKVMTMLLAMEEIDSGRMKLEDIITGSAHAKSYGGSTIFLDEGEQISVRDILKGIAVASGNDAAVAMGEHISGSEEEFVKLMNNKAQSLGMTNTHFVNCCGLDADGHYSTARDISVMSRELMRHNMIFDFTGIWMDSLRDGKFTLSNTNKLIRFYNGATGLKTGSTSKAGFCISATAKRDNMHLIAVIMNAETSKKRQADASALLNFGFNTYKMVNAVDDNKKVAECVIDKGEKNKINVKPDGRADYVLPKSNKEKITTKIFVEKKISAPVKKGDKVGSIKIYFDNKCKNTLKLVACESVSKISFLKFYKIILKKWVTAV